METHGNGPSFVPPPLTGTDITQKPPEPNSLLIDERVFQWKQGFEKNFPMEAHGSRENKGLNKKKQRSPIFFPSSMRFHWKNFRKPLLPLENSFVYTK
jgi:hypothetical protein